MIPIPKGVNPALEDAALAMYADSLARFVARGFPELPDIPVLELWLSADPIDGYYFSSRPRAIRLSLLPPWPGDSPLEKVFRACCDLSCYDAALVDHSDKTDALVWHRRWHRDGTLTEYVRGGGINRDLRGYLKRDLRASLSKRTIDHEIAHTYFEQMALSQRQSLEELHGQDRTDWELVHDRFTMPIHELFAWHTEDWMGSDGKKGARSSRMDFLLRGINDPMAQLRLTQRIAAVAQQHPMRVIEAYNAAGGFYDFLDRLKVMAAEAGPVAPSPLLR